MTSAAILGWHEFFVTIAQVGATLAGLLFVGLTISLAHLLQAGGYLSRAFAALFLQFETLLIGLFGLVPVLASLAARRRIRRLGPRDPRRHLGLCAQFPRG